MNTGRLVGASLAVWIVRVLLNYLFYGVWKADDFAALNSAHPGIFREVIPAYIAADLVFAVIFVILFAKVASCLGGGVKAGVVLAIFVALLSAVLGNVYIFYSFTIYTGGMVVTDSIFQLVSHAISGALAGAIYKS